MKTIGLIGGTGWVSSIEYYRFINKEINKRLGGHNFARCILFSINHGDIIDFINKKDMDGIYALLLDASSKLFVAGADCILLCANTLHMFADKLETQISVPLIHIVDATTKEIKKQHISKIGLLGTKATMEQDFYKSKFSDSGIEVIVPRSEERGLIHKIIIEELIKDIFTKESREQFINIIQTLKSKGAKGIVLGCTEIPLLVKQEDSDIPLFDTTLIHSLAAVDFALST